MTKVEKYINALATYQFADPKGPSAKMAKKLKAILDEKGPEAVVAFADALRHDNDKLSRGAFRQVLGVCALSRLDKTGSLEPFYLSDISPLAQKIALGG